METPGVFKPQETETKDENIHFNISIFLCCRITLSPESADKQLILDFRLTDYWAGLNRPLCIIWGIVDHFTNPTSHFFF